MGVDRDYLTGRGFLYADYAPRFQRQYNYRPRSLSLRISIDVDGRSISGLARYELESWGLLEFDAVEMKISGVAVDGSPSEFHYDGRVLAVDVPQGTHSVSIEYSTVPRKGVYFAERKGRMFVWSHGETEDNRYWIPLPDSPYVKFPTEVTVIAPAWMTAVSNGVLQGVREAGDRREWTWRLDHPHSPYLIAIAAGDFEVIGEDCGGTPLEYYVPRDAAQHATLSFHRTCDVLKFFEEYTGLKYQWPNYKQVVVPEFIYGGMENTTSTLLMDYTLHDEHAHCPGTKFPCPGMEDYTSDPLVAHELAHQWFGDLVTTEDWPHIWLNESFATFMEAIYERHALGEDEFRYTLYRCLRTYLSEYRDRYARPIVFRIYKDPEELFDTHSYEKGCLVLWHLVNTIGEDAFRTAINRYLVSRSFGPASSDDLKDFLEDSSKKRLDWFFYQFLESSGHPVVRYSWEYDASTSTLRLKVEQAQGDDSYPEYRLDLEALISTDRGERMVKVKLHDRSTTLQVQVDGKPKYVCIDPEFRAFIERRPQKGLEDAVNQLSSPYLACRLEAVAALQEDGSGRAVEALAKALASDGFWGVRAEAARALGKVGGEAALSALISSMKSERHPRVRQAVADALGSFRAEPRAAEVLRSVLLDEHESYYARARAASSLGRAGGEQYLQSLIDAIGYGGHNWSITVGAIEGLSKVGGSQALSTILRETERGNDTLVRAAAVRALGAFPDSPQALDRIRDLIRDPSFRVRRAAVEAAERVSSPRLLDALDEASSKDVDGRIRRLSRDAARRIREAMEKGAEYAKLRDDIDRMREEQRRLEDRLSRLERVG
ncbi:MAG: M1 family aminopeptidase [Conexivisphaera sp.]